MKFKLKNAHFDELGSIEILTFDQLYELSEAYFEEVNANRRNPLNISVVVNFTDQEIIFYDDWLE